MPRTDSTRRSRGPRTSASKKTPSWWSSMWQVAQLTPVFFTSVKNSIWPRRRSRCCGVAAERAGERRRARRPRRRSRSLGLTSTVAIDVVNWFTTQSVFAVGARARCRAGRCAGRPGCSSSSTPTGSPSTSVGQPPQLASLVHTTPGVAVNAAHTLRAEARRRSTASASVGTVDVDRQRQRERSPRSAGTPRASAAVSSTSTRAAALAGDVEAAARVVERHQLGIGARRPVAVEIVQRDVRDDGVGRGVDDGDRRVDDRAAGLHDALARSGLRADAGDEQRAQRVAEDDAARRAARR